MCGGEKGDHLSTGGGTTEDAGEDGGIGSAVSGRGGNCNAGGRICGHADGLPAYAESRYSDAGWCKVSVGGRQWKGTGIKQA